MYCPKCKEELIKKDGTGVGMWSCKSCGHIFFIVITSKGDKYDQ